MHNHPLIVSNKHNIIFFPKKQNTYMELSPFYHSSVIHYYFSSPRLFLNYHFIPQNYVHWAQTPESHIYSADMPGVRKEEIRVELEDSKYLIIRTEVGVNDLSNDEPRRCFRRKFRLPGHVDVEGIAAEYVAGVLTVTVPRSFVRRGVVVDVPHRSNHLARAA